MGTHKTSPETGVVITGGASGIGRATARALAATGRPVALWDIAAGPVEEAAKEIEAEHGVRALGLALDVTDTEAYPGAIQASAEALGTIGGFVHAAGIVDSTPITEVTAENWDRVLDVNLRSFALLVQALTPHLREHAGSAIVGIASLNAIVGNALNPSYCASKSGMLGLNRSIAAKLAEYHIRSNVVCPGYVETPMLARSFARPGTRERMENSSPLGRLGRPEEIAGAIRFLLSDEASFVTGTHLMVDGGMTETV
ncbi:SDR family NAD(P)-dependent oxidoreductase [Embleya sp. NPDC050154]|uniref:SDR family NAD(P)-dependent oxidoreductase n=1 Tax=Embleya sp. NPDC050154 TaxID=3363988 RepID=UPI0037AE8C10